MSLNNQSATLIDTPVPIPNIQVPRVQESFDSQNFVQKNSVILSLNTASDKLNISVKMSNQNPDIHPPAPLPKQAPIVPPASLPNQQDDAFFHVQNVQRLLKKDVNNTDEIIVQAREKLATLKKQLVLDAKKNWVVEREVDTFGTKIKLLIKSHIQAEEMKNLLDSSDKKSELRDISEKEITVFENIFYLLRSNPSYLSRLTRNVRGKNIDTFIQTVVFTLFGDQFDEREENLLLQLFEAVLIQEFENCSQIGEFMRSNNAFTKMLNAVLRRSSYYQYLVKVISDPLQKALSDPKLNLEINPAKVWQAYAEENPSAVDTKDYANDPIVQKIIEPRIQKIKDITLLFLQRIYASVNDTPYGIRFVSKKILQYGCQYFKSSAEADILSLVGGFVFLRFINPAITTCDSGSVQLVNYQLDQTQRKNLTMICKVLQNLSNGMLFGAKERYMTPLNDFLESQLPHMHGFFKQICVIEDVDARLEIDKFFELSKEARTINISYNEVALIHQLCKDNIQTVCPDSSDMFRTLLSKLGDDTIPQVDKKSNYYFNLKLTNPNREQIVQQLGNDADSIARQMRISIANILRAVPTLPVPKNTFISLVDVLRASEALAAEKKDQFFAAKVKEVLVYLYELEKTNALPPTKGKEKYDSILRDIVEDIKNKSSLREQLEQKIKTLEKVVHELNERHKYLISQLEMYKSYLNNALSQTFNASGKQNAVQGPFKYKFTELEKNGVIQSSTIPKALHKSVKVSFSSSKPGTFLVMASGILGKKVEITLEMNDLLDRQAKGLKSIEMDYVTLDLDRLILWLNKIFVLNKNKAKSATNLAALKKLK